jgi:hypothetical protein
MNLERAGRPDTMTGQLITLPARLYIRGARLLLNVAEDVTERAVMSTLRVAGTLGNLVPGPGGSSSAPSTSQRPSTPSPSRQRQPSTGGSSNGGSAQSSLSHVNGSGGDTQTVPRDPRADATQGDPEPMAPQPTAEAEPLASERLEQEGVSTPIDLDADISEPTHVSEDPVVVRESAEPGAEDGAGASVSVAEPWEGYAKMSARDVVTRLSGASTAELAAVQLYETASRARQSVLQAAAREFRTADRGQ